MKRFALAALALMLLLSLCACRKQETRTPPVDMPEPPETEEEVIRENWTSPEYYSLGTVIAVNETTSFRLNGLKLAGNRAETAKAYEAQIEAPYTLADVSSVFKLGEWIEFYLDTDFDFAKAPGQIRIVCIPHRELADYQYMEAEDLIARGEAQGFALSITGIDNEYTENLAGSGCVSSEHEAGNYDLLFLNGDRVCYYMVIGIIEAE